ncbi:hypothetical protein [Ktedonospora formicarum]|uniref:hypothetical protein n=1 Tax=Ktedonospora formicarum TaxID=2778364 RepID=UPI001C68B269|nr:hypothetical protein [Ktedonospora formicarum]
MKHLAVCKTTSLVIMSSMIALLLLIGMAISVSAANVTASKSIILVTRNAPHPSTCNLGREVSGQLEWRCERACIGSQPVKYVTFGFTANTVSYERAVARADEMARQCAYYR